MMEQTTSSPEHPHDDDTFVSEPYSIGEMIYWILGILSIPLVPIIMVKLLTPMSGV